MRKKLVYLTAAPGLLADPADPESVITKLTAAEARTIVTRKAVSDGMIPKLTDCVEAVDRASAARTSWTDGSRTAC